MSKYSQEQFINKARQVHGDRYDYSQSIYIDSQTKVCIICPEHGEFWQTPASHLRGNGCIKCHHEKMKQQSPAELVDKRKEFIRRAQETHGDCYDYSKVVYVNSNTKVCIICPDHGEFWQTPIQHVKGHKCPKCNKNRPKTKEEFIEIARQIHDDKYDYSQVEYKSGMDKVCIICPEHGPFWQTLTKHTAKKQGCPKCGIIKRSRTQSTTKEEFINKARQIHGNAYDYSLIDFQNMHDKVQIRCIKHDHLFTQIAADHLIGHGCPKCGTIMSNAEDELVEFIKGLGLNVETHNRKILPDNQEIDIFIPSLSIGIEYDGLIWHSDKFKTDNNYHLRKTEQCTKRGIHLIHIFEDEYRDNKDIVQAKIKHLLHKTDGNEVVFARKCDIQPISMGEAKAFLTSNHIQGFNGAKVYLGAFNEGRLVGVMTFKEWKSGEWELARFATDNSLRCVGLGGKLFSYFTHHYQYKTIKSFADRRWTLSADDNLYTRLGFVLKETLKPDYYYVSKNGKQRFHKFGFRKAALLGKYKDCELTNDMTEREMTRKLGFYRIWNCGLLSYIYINKEDNL